MDIKNVPTQELITELQTRKGVKIAWFDSTLVWGDTTMDGASYPEYEKEIEKTPPMIGGTIFVDEDVWRE